MRWRPSARGTLSRYLSGVAVSAMQAACVTVRCLSPKGEEAVLAQLLGLEKRLFKKADAWGGQRERRGLQTPHDRLPPPLPLAAAALWRPAGRLPIFPI